MQTAAVPNLWRRFEGICKLDFSSSGDCGRLEKCCSNGCDMRCTTDIGNLFDNDCGRLEKCCSNGCDMKCTTDIG